MAMRYQPQGLMRIARTPLTAGLRVAVLPGVNRGYDAASGRHPVVVGTKQVASGTGMASGFGATLGVGTTDRVSTGITGAFPASGRSYYFRAKRTGTGGGGLGRLFDKTNSQTSGQFFCWEESNTRLRYGYYTAASERIVGVPGTATTAAIGEVFELLFTHFFDGTNNTFNAWVNGERVLADSIVANVVSDNATADFVIGNRATGSRNWDGLIECAYVWDRILTIDDVAALRANRYALYEDPSEDEDLFVAVASSGATANPGGVSASASVGAVTASAGARSAPVGVSASANVGAAVASAGATATALGVSASGQVGALTTTAGAKASPLGVSASAQVGTATASGGSASTAFPAGVSVSASVGTATAIGSANAAPAGVAASAEVGIATALAGASVSGTANPTGISASASVGIVTVSASASCAPAGVTGFASVGAVIAAGNIAIPATAAPLGVVAFARVGTAVAIGGGVFARAPAGSGYTPQRNEYQSRPVQPGSARPAAIQRNRR